MNNFNIWSINQTLSPISTNGMSDNETDTIDTTSTHDEIAREIHEPEDAVDTVDDEFDHESDETSISDIEFDATIWKERIFTMFDLIGATSLEYRRTMSQHRIGKSDIYYIIQKIAEFHFRMKHSKLLDYLGKHVWISEQVHILKKRCELLVDMASCVDICQKKYKLCIASDDVFFRMQLNPRDCGLTSDCIDLLIDFCNFGHDKIASFIFSRLYDNPVMNMFDAIIPQEFNDIDLTTIVPHETHSLTISFSIAPLPSSWRRQHSEYTMTHYEIQLFIAHCCQC